MSYSTINMYQTQSQSTSVTGILAGAAVGAVIGAVCLSFANAAAPSTLYTASAVRPAAVSAYAPVALPVQARSYAATTMAAGRVSVKEQEDAAQTQGTAVYGLAFGLFAAVAGAVNGLFLWNNRRVAVAANTGRREALMAGVAATGIAAGPAFAAYGDAANVFGKPKEVDQFFEIKGDGWVGKMPGKYNVSREREVPGMVGRWEDNFDAVNAAYVLVRDTNSSSVTDLGSLDDVRQSIVTPLLGQQAFDGQSISEGGFAPGRYAAAAILDQQAEVKNGKTYYVYELLTRTADGNEGGRHQLFSIAVSNGKLYVFKTQAGDKRWFKGLERPLRASVAAFTVA